MKVFEQNQPDIRFTSERLEFTETTCDDCGEVILESEKRFAREGDVGVMCEECKGPMVEQIENTLIEGDPLQPHATDLILQRGRLAVGQPVPQDWRVLTGNASHSLVARVVYRHEVS
jgi:hypothetical protein